MSVRDAVYWLLLVAGASQLALCVGTLWVPTVLRWREKLADLPTLERQMFWNYALYIWFTNLALALVSLRPDWLLDGSPLAACVAGYACAYWTGRVLVQWFVFDLGELPTGGFHTVARVLMEVLFVALSVVYGATVALNVGWL